MQIEFNAKKREGQGTGASRRLRRAGRVPGIVYGGGDAQQIDVDHNEIFHKLKLEAFHSSILTMDLEGVKQTVLLRDVQAHPYKLQVLHVDFQRVDATHKIHVKVPLHFVNEDKCPGVKLQGGIVSHQMNEVDVECLPGDLPEFIEVDLSELSSNAALHVTGIKMPAGVSPVLHRGDDPVVATVLQPKAAAEAAEGEAGAQSAEVPATKQSAPDKK